jgi:hypothetical protein
MTPEEAEWRSRIYWERAQICAELRLALEREVTAEIVDGEP